MIFTRAMVSAESGFGNEKRAVEHLQKKGSFWIAIIAIFAEDLPEFVTQVYELFYGNLGLNFIHLFPTLTEIFGNSYNVQLLSIVVTVFHFLSRVIVMCRYGAFDPNKDNRSYYRYSRFP